ncbi:hypothetical protein [Nevskia soli]|uniref:hypothetical protein n=1 Tax=Nevskia soli TaxID=418856 RepID=UPI0012F8C2A6|nr:hypothetical protein [Nevskia soli]
MAMLVEFHAGARDVRMVLTMDAMHDEAWTRNMSMGWESEQGGGAAGLRVIAVLDRTLINENNYHY